MVESGQKFESAFQSATAGDFLSFQLLVPYGVEVSPQTIREEEELERLAGLQWRDSLVRGLGISEQLSALLNSGNREKHCVSRNAPQQPDSDSKALFFTHTVFHDSSHTHSSEQANPLPPTTTALHTLPGSTSWRIGSGVDMRSSQHTRSFHTHPSLCAGHRSNNRLV